EDRLAPVTNMWMGGNADWAATPVTNFWSLGHTPLSSEDVQIANGATVTHSAVSDTVHSLSISGGSTLVLSGGSITDSTTLEDSAGSFKLQSGNLIGATVTRTPTIFSTITGISGQLTNVTIAGALDMQTNNSVVEVSGNLSLPGGIVRLGDNGANFTFGQLFFIDGTPQTVDGVAGAGNAGTIVFGTRSNSLIRSNTAVLTLGPN